MTALEQFGFSTFFQNQSGNDGWKIARVTAIHKGWSDICDGETTRPAKTTGKLRREARGAGDYLTVGDWVRVKDFDHPDFAMIHAVLERQNVLQRKVPGRRTAWQLLAANIDTVFVVHTLDKGFNLRKLERYLSIIFNSGITPVILLSKKDLLTAKELSARMDEVKKRIPSVPVFAFSNTTGAGLKEVQSLFKPRKTYCLLGASGTGKTSLINSLLGEKDLYFTLPVRERDGKGVHSTTWRELITLDNGALVIDTPGMRELGHLDSAAGIDDTFDEIIALECECKFRDCAHVNTKGCAVMAAVETGKISPARYGSFIRMKQEADAAEKASREKHWKNR
ncbi:MAG: ribosome small subunit-dependent GTPase A [Kiritimatiellales bacterium]